MIVDQLLRTKRIPPPARPDLVHRARLFDLLQLGLQSRLTLLSAPAGAGKTTLLRTWRVSSVGADVPLAWVSLDSGDNDSVRFWRYVVAALDVVLPGVEQKLAGHFRNAPPVPLEQTITALLNELASIEEDTVLVLDDYHTIEIERIHETMTFFIDRLPPSIHVVLIARSDPPLPLARWRGRGELVEVREQELRFSIDETEHLFAGMTGLELAPDQISRIAERTEGWAAGLHLATLALRSSQNIEQFLSTFSGRHEFIQSYLIEDVLVDLPDDAMRFLLETSILGELSASLCDAVTRRDDGEHWLNEFSAANLFISPLDEAHQWFRYHQLFSDALRDRLRETIPDMVRELHRRAAAWYQSHQLPVHAVDHAFSAGALSWASDLVAEASETLLPRGEATLVRRWLDRLPAEVRRRHPRVCIAAARSLLVTGPLADAVPWLDDAEQAASSDEQNAGLRAEINAMRAVHSAFAGSLPGTVERATRALEQLPSENVNLRAGVHLAMGIAKLLEGEIDQADQAFSDAYDAGRAAPNAFLMISALVNRGRIREMRGELPQALEIFAAADDAIRKHNAEHLLVASLLPVRQAAMYREWNDLERAEQLVMTGIEMARERSHTFTLFSGFLELARIRIASIDLSEARRELQRAQTFGEQYGYVNTRRVCDALTALCMLRDGDRASAVHWLESTEITLPAADLSDELEHVIAARILVDSGKFPAAIEMIDPVIDRAAETGRRKLLAELLVTRAVANSHAGDQPAARDALQKALECATPGRLVQTFRLENQELQTVIPEINLDVFPQEYVEMLQDAGFTPIASQRKDQPASGRTSEEPLSEREQAVLRLLVAGLRAPEIARELFVAPSTVRSHVKSIYRKLDVHSRDQAIARVRELDSH